MRIVFVPVALTIALVVAGCSASGEPNDNTDAPTVWIIGDSITVAASDRLTDAIPGIMIDAEEGRQFRHAPPILEELIAGDAGPDILVIALGTNGPIDEAHLADVVRLAGDADVMFVNVHVPRDWEPQVNGALAGAADDEGAVVVDWRAIAVTDDGLLRTDGYHPSGRGLDAWTDAIALVVGR